MGEEQIETGQCRICLDECPVGQLLTQPCGCAGTLRHVHPECLKAWALVRGGSASRCEVCQQPLLPYALKLVTPEGLPGRVPVSGGVLQEHPTTWFTATPGPYAPLPGQDWYYAADSEYSASGRYGHGAYGGFVGTAGGGSDEEGGGVYIGGGLGARPDRSLGQGTLRLSYQALLLRGEQLGQEETSQQARVSQCCWLLLAYTTIVALLVAAFYAYALMVAMLSYDSEWHVGWQGRGLGMSYQGLPDY